MLMIIALSFAFSINTKSQTAIDSILFDMINQYRLENKICPFIWDSCAYKMAQHHSEYLVVMNQNRGALSTHVGTDSIWISHDEEYNYNNFKSIKTVENRLSKYGSRKFNLTEISICSENAAGNCRYKQDTNYDIAKRIFIGWKGSVQHNKIMLSKSKTKIFAGCSLSELNGYTNFNVNNKIINVQSTHVFAVLNLYSYYKQYE
jgi:uncharacterized protein YkwD